MSRLSRNILANLLGQGLVLVLGFVAVRYVFTRLGADALGIIYFSITLSAVLYSVLEMGIGSTVVREISAHVHDEPGYVRELIRTASLFYWGAYGLLVVVVYLGAPLLVGKWINLKDLDAATASRMVQILGIGTLTVLPRSLYDSVLRGFQRMEFNNLIEVATLGLQQFGIVLILVLGGGLMPVIYWLTASFWLGVLAYLLAAAHFVSFRPLVPGFSAQVVSRNFRYSSNMAAISILATVHMQADKVIVSKLLPIGTFAFYAFASSVVSRLTLVTNAISRAAFPSFAALFQRGDRPALLSQYRKLQDLLCFSTLPILAAIPFAAFPLFSYLLNAEAARMLRLPVVLLCIGTYMNATLHIPYVFSLAAGRPEITVRLNLYALFVVLPIAAILVYFLGLVGAGLSWVFYHVFAYVYAVPRMCREPLGIPVSEWFGHTLRIVILAALTYGIAWVILVSLDAGSMVFAAIAYLGASVAFAAGAYWMMGDGLRETLLGLLKPIGVKIVGVLIPSMNAKRG